MCQNCKCQKFTLGQIYEAALDVRLSSKLPHINLDEPLKKELHSLYSDGFDSGFAAHKAELESLVYDEPHKNKLKLDI